MNLELKLKKDNGELIAKISAHTLEHLEEQLNKIAMAIETENERERDEFEEENREKLETEFAKNNSSILDDDLPDAYSSYIMGATLQELKDLIK